MQGHPAAALNSKKSLSKRLFWDLLSLSSECTTLFHAACLSTGLFNTRKIQQDLSKVCLKLKSLGAPFLGKVAEQQVISPFSQPSRAGPKQRCSLDPQKMGHWRSVCECCDSTKNPISHNNKLNNLPLASNPFQSKPASQGFPLLSDSKTHICNAPCGFLDAKTHKFPLPENKNVWPNPLIRSPHK